MRERPGGTDPTAQPGALEAMAVDLARAAGELIVDQRPEHLGVAATKTSGTDVVTVMDRRSEQLLRERIRALRPQDAVYGEEYGAAGNQGSRPVSGLTWVVDPIDGTVNYLYGIPAYAVSVAVVTGDPSSPGAWRSLAGAVVNPVSRELFHASAGGGAFFEAGPDREPVRIRMGAPPAVDHALVATGFGYRREDRARDGALAAAMLPRIRDIRRIGSAALDLCYVAIGRVDGYYEAGLHVWDIAAAALVLTEAGGTVTGLRGQPPSESMVLAAAPALHRRLHDLLVQYAAPTG